MEMKEILSKQSKETRCYIMAAVLVFEGYKGVDELTEVEGEMKLDVLSLTKEEMEKFPMPKDFSQIVAHLRPISDTDVRHWVITNTYSPVLQSQRKDALRDFRAFCVALGWNPKEIKEDMELLEDLLEIKPISSTEGVRAVSKSGCFPIIAMFVVFAMLLSFTML